MLDGYENYVEILENFIEQCWKMTDEQNEELKDEEILKAIEDSEDKKATGPEGISNEMMKRGGRSLTNSIFYNDENGVQNRGNSREMEHSIHKESIQRER